MKYTFSVLTTTVLVNFIQVMSIFALPSKFTGNKINFMRKKYEAVSYDNPNTKQALLSQMFISTANNLFNKEQPQLIEYYKQLNDYNKPELKPQVTYNPTISKNEGTSKNKGDRVGYYSMEINGNDGDLENIGEHSLIDTYSTVNNRLPRFTHALPVQCMKTDAYNLFCVHGDIIYRLRLPNFDFTEDDIGNLVETIYKEIELKHKSSFNNKIHKREIDCHENFGKDENIVLPLISEQNNSQILTFSLPHDEDEHNDISLTEDDNKDKFAENDTNSVNYFNPKDPPPLDYLSPENVNNVYSSKWLSKREINIHRNYKHDIKKRRIIPPKCITHITTEKRPSVNDGKTGKCYLPKCGEHICLMKTPCPCSYAWPKIPDPTTCPPLPPLLPPEVITRCPAYKFTEETCASTRRSNKKATTTEAISTTEATSTTQVEEQTTEDPCLVENRYRKKDRRLHKKLRPKRNNKRYIIKSFIT